MLQEIREAVAALSARGLMDPKVESEIVRRIECGEYGKGKNTAPRRQ